MDDTNFISRENIYDAFKHFGVKATQAEIEEIFQRHDQGHNNQLSFDEFKVMMSQIT